MEPEYAYNHSAKATLPKIRNAVFGVHSDEPWL